MGKNGFAKNQAPFPHQGVQIAGGRDHEPDPAQMAFVVAIHREADPFIGSECSYKIEHTFLGCVVQESD